ncbi:MAG: tetratricopeptide repeat protein [Candidatus Omnitrophica bacterium]|nr:tetratricopeptide repeat protein [Candidatus Omnitrophota bacterium]
MPNKKVLVPGAFFKQRLLLVTFGILFFFILLESSLRLGGFIILSIQEHRNYQSIKQKGAYRILCLGESTTQNQYPPFLEEILNQRNIGIHFSVIDKGLRGTNTPTILNNLESYLAQYHPDMVVAMMGINDRGDYIPLETSIDSKHPPFLKSLQTYKLARLLWLHIMNKAREAGLCCRNNPAGTKYEKYSMEFIPAEKLLKDFIKHNPQNDNAYAGLGWLYRNEGKFIQAEILFKRALELNPQNDSAYAGLGWLYRDQQKYSLAEIALKKAAELNPKNDNVYTELGWLYRSQGKYFQAEEAFGKALELNPGNTTACLVLGWSYKNQDKNTQAEVLFKRALERNPENAYVYGALLSFYEQIGKPELAKEYARKANALRLNYYHPIIVHNYRRLKEILSRQKIKLVCVQYPVRSVEPLKKIFPDDKGVIFVDNEKIFKEALQKSGYKEYFRDMFAGDFGHCTEKGNRLLAENIACTILKEVFNK